MSVVRRGLTSEYPQITEARVNLARLEIESRDMKKSE